MGANIDKYYNAFLTSQIALCRYDTEGFPYNIKRILNQNNCIISTLNDYNTYNPNSNLQIEEANCFYESKSNTYLIIYNEKKIAKRIYFSLAHELGHILMNHFSYSENEKNYYIMEGEANTFAGNFLAPPILIREVLNCSSWNTQKIANTFRISEDSAERRKVDYKLWLKSNPSMMENLILKRYRDFNSSYKKYFYNMG